MAEITPLSPCNAHSYIIWENATVIAYLHTKPPTPGTVLLEHKVNKTDNIFNLPLNEFLELLIVSKQISSHLCKSLSVQRCAMVTTPSDSAQIRILPLHGLSTDWNAQIVDDVEFNATYPGYCNSLNGPKSPDEVLDEIRSQIRSKLVNQDISYVFHGDQTDQNLFARIVLGEIQQWRIWENEDHVAFLTPFPNTPGYTVLVPRKHLPSDIFSLQDDDYIALIRAAYNVAKLLEESLEAQTCSMIFEGYEIDYAHVKLIPVFKGVTEQNSKTYWCEKYEGFVTSLDGPPMSDEELSKLREQIGPVVPDIN